MDELSTRKCEACQIGAPLVTQQEIDDYMPQLPHWEIIEVNGVQQLRRTYTFNNFTEALSFSNKVGEIANQENHHPAILTEWGKVTVSWWSHKIHGLHANDFIMAAKTDALLK